MKLSECSANFYRGHYVSVDVRKQLFTSIPTVSIAIADTHSQYPDSKEVIGMVLPLSSANTSFHRRNDDANSVPVIPTGRDVVLFWRKNAIAKKYRGFASQTIHSSVPPPKITMPPMINSAIPEDCVCSPRLLHVIAFCVNDNTKRARLIIISPILNRVVLLLKS